MGCNQLFFFLKKEIENQTSVCMVRVLSSFLDAPASVAGLHRVHLSLCTQSVGVSAPSLLQQRQAGTRGPASMQPFLGHWLLSSLHLAWAFFHSRTLRTLCRPRSKVCLSWTRPCFPYSARQSSGSIDLYGLF